MSDDQIRVSARENVPHQDSESVASTIEWVAEATAAVTGEDFFRRLVRKLAEWLQADTAIIIKCPEKGQNTAETLAVWYRGELQPNTRIDLGDTPCESLVRDELFKFAAEGIANEFPEWSAAQGDVQSFVGVPARDSRTGEVAAYIVVYDREPMAADSIIESMFRIVAARTGAEIKRMEAEQAQRDSEAVARQHLRELAVLNRRATVSEVASTLAHEIKQPLTALTAYLRTAKRIADGPNPDHAQIGEAIEESLTSAERVNEIISRLREWIGEHKLNIESLALHEVIDKSRALLDADLRSHDSSLELKVPNGLPPIAGDSILLQQVLFNLVHNAIKALDRANNHTHPIVIEAFEADDGNKLQVEVSDNGEGIAAGLIDQLFEPFHGSRDNGMGIGLYLCRSIVESHGGKLWLDTDSDKTRFCFTLPVAD